MIIRANNNSYEVIKTIKAHNVNMCGINAINEQQNYIKNIIEKNKSLVVLNTGDVYFICQEIEEANYKEITDNKLISENKNDNI